MKKNIVNREISEMPADYQAGCHMIEKQCHDLLTVSKITFDDIYWNKLNLHGGYLQVNILNKIYSVKFGKRALTHFHEEVMMETIMVRLKVLLNKIKFSR